MQRLMFERAPVASSEQGIWTLEFIKARPGMLGPTIGYLDDSWMRVREQAKQEGAIVNYHRMAEVDANENDWNILLLTQYEDDVAYDAREKIFASILEGFSRNATAIIKGYTKEDLYHVVRERVLRDFPGSGNPRMRLLSDTNKDSYNL